MKKIVLIDGHNILYSSYHSTNSIKDLNNLEFEQMWKYIFFKNLLNIKKKYNPNEIVFAVDQGSWRKNIFPYYKARRVLKKSKLDYQNFKEISTKIIKELNDHFPYKVVSVNEAEGDDVIAVLTEYLRLNHKIIVVSRDKDYLQLTKYNNVKLYNSIDDKDVVGDPHLFLIEHIIKGDSIDDIPNILSEDKVFVTGKRQKSITKKVLKEVYDLGLIEFVNKYNLEDNYKRNKALIQLDLDTIPNDIQNKIINEYKNSNIKNEFILIFKYFLKNNIKKFGDIASEFCI